MTKNKPISKGVIVRPADKNRKRKSVYKPHTTTPKTAEYEQFVLWCATPVVQRKNDEKTQGQFSTKYGVHMNTLSEWKQRDDFDTKVRNYVKKNVGQVRIADLVHKLAQNMLNSKKPFGRDFIHFLEYVDNFARNVKVETPIPSTLTEEERRAYNEKIRLAGMTALATEQPLVMDDDGSDVEQQDHDDEN